MSISTSAQLHAQFLQTIDYEVVFPGTDDIYVNKHGIAQICIADLIDVTSDKYYSRQELEDIFLSKLVALENSAVTLNLWVNYVGSGQNLTIDVLPTYIAILTRICTRLNIGFDIWYLNTGCQEYDTFVSVDRSFWVSINNPA